MTRIPTDQLQAMLAGCEGVTPGPWQVKYVGDGRMAFAIADSDGVSLLTIVEEDHAGFAAVYSDGDAAHLVDCDPDTIRSLVSELLALRAAVALMTEEARKDNALLGRSDGLALNRLRVVLAEINGGAHV